MYFEAYNGYSEYIPWKMNTAFFFSFKTTNCIFKDILKSSLSCNAHTCMCR